MSYSPSLGRWLEADPLGFAAGDNNLYRALGNNPGNHVDPLGLRELGIDMANVLEGDGSEPEPAGTTYDLPQMLLGGFPGRMVNPCSKKDLLQKCRIITKDEIKVLLEPPKQGTGTGKGWTGIIPPGGFAGVSGAGPCVGVILVPTKSGQPTFVFHFDARCNVDKGFMNLGAYKPGGQVVKVPNQDRPGYIYFRFPGALDCYEAVICGAEHRKKDPEGQKQMLHTLQDVMLSLGLLGYPIKGYVPAPNVHVDANGNLYWTTPDAQVLDDYSIEPHETKSVVRPQKPRASNTRPRKVSP